MLFTERNPTPSQLALITAANTGIFSLSSLLLIKLIFPYLISWWLVPFFSLAIFAVTYYAVSEALSRFIYRKIKLIYKTIHRLKAPKANGNNKIDLRSHIIDDVEREVREWAADQEQEFENLKKLEEYRRNFIGNVSHELKTPIFNIQGYLYTLIDGELEDPNIIMPYLQKAADNVDRLETIVQDLITIAQLESGGLSLEMTRFNLYDLAREVLEDLNFMAQERNIKLGFKDSAKRAYYVRADREAIRQVLTNLITNSIKYGKEGGRTLMGFYDLDTNILVEVSDDGIGIQKEHLPRLFERFYRVDKGRSRDQGGTGLGLAIVKHLIEAHNQTVNVRSTVGIGSTFGFTLEKEE